QREATNARQRRAPRLRLRAGDATPIDHPVRDEGDILPGLPVATLWRRLALLNRPAELGGGAPRKDRARAAHRRRRVRVAAASLCPMIYRTRKRHRNTR